MDSFSHKFLSVEKTIYKFLNLSKSRPVLSTDPSVKLPNTPSTFFSCLWPCFCGLINLIDDQCYVQHNCVTSNTVNVFRSQTADTSDSGIPNGASPQGRNQMKFSAETGDEARRLDAMLDWIRETRV